MRKIICLVLSVLMLLPLFGCGKATPVHDMGTLTAMEYVDAFGVGINLGNTFDCSGDWIDDSSPHSFETAWGSPIITQEMINCYADMGFGVMRLPVSWLNMADEEGNIDAAWMDRIDEVVSWILDSGMYCVMNSHHDGWPEQFEADPDKALAKFINMWEQICKRFEKYDERLMFESMNEVGFDNMWNSYAGTEGKQEAFDLFNGILQSFVDTVRASGPNNSKRYLLISAYWTSIERACDEMFEFPTDPENRLAISVHYYGPSTLCLIDEDVSWGKARTDWGSDADYKELNMWMDMMKEHYIDKGIPVIVGEYGCFGDNKTKEVKQQWTMDVATACLTRDICPILWDTPGGEFWREELYFPRADFLSELIALNDKY